LAADQIPLEVLGHRGKSLDQLKNVREIVAGIARPRSSRRVAPDWPVPVNSVGMA